MPKKSSTVIAFVFRTNKTPKHGTKTMRIFFCHLYVHVLAYVIFLEKNDT